MMTSLSIAQQRRREACEGDIRNGINGVKSNMRKIGVALQIMRDEKLYLSTHATFEGYCSDVWNLSRPRAYQLIDHASTVKVLTECEALSTIVDTISEGATRELSGLEPERKVEIVKIASDGGRVIPTAKGIKIAREQIIEKATDNLDLAKPSPVCNPSQETQKARVSITSDRGNPLPDETEEERQEREARERLAQISNEELLKSAFIHSEAAIDCLRKIPRDAPRRTEAFDSVIKWATHFRDRYETA